VTDRIAVSVSYTKVSSRMGIKQDGLAGVVSVRF
jgi:hypothetical protein